MYVTTVKEKMTVDLRENKRNTWEGLKKEKKKEKCAIILSKKLHSTHV